MQSRWKRVCIPHLLIVALNLQRTKAQIALIALGWWLYGWRLLCAHSPPQAALSELQDILSLGSCSKDAQTAQGWGALTGEGTILGPSLWLCVFRGCHLTAHDS